MGSFTAITIFLLVVIIFSILILVAILTIQRHRINNPYHDCNNNKDCLLGYVCIADPANTQGICRGISGTFCSSKIQCQPGLQCVFTTNSTGSTGGTGICMSIVVPSIVPVAPIPPIPPLPPVKSTVIISTPFVTENINPVLLASEIQLQKLQIEQLQSTFIKRPILTSMLQANSSTDNEINSVGCTSDGPFDLRSQCSTARSTSSIKLGQCRATVSTPCEERNGIYYCRKSSNINEASRVNELENEINVAERSTVVDVCSYSSATIYLLDNGNIICENENGRWRATNNIKLQRIVSYDGYIYGVSETRSLYKLSNNDFGKNIWLWTVVDWAPYNIMYICTTLDSKSLWIQARENEEKSTRGWLYTATGVVFHDAIGIKRIYGRDTDHYLDINLNNYTAVLYPGATNINDIYDAALSYYNDVMSISSSEKQSYRAITIVDWKPYYIRR